MFASSVIARGKAVLQGSETEQRIAVLLYDDSVQVISTFELNQLASLTYHDTTIVTSQKDMSDVIVDHLEQIQSQPMSYSVTTVQKSLVVTRHILLHGSEQVVPRIRQQLGRHIETLCQYNTVLAAQQNNTSTAWFMRLQGGGVDQAGPIRATATPLTQLLSNAQSLQFERAASADPNSLVPVGHRSQVAFVTDAVRFDQLKQRMEQEQLMHTRSNLTKASNGFGGGYNAANGKTVVGAAHGIEEMLQHQQRIEQRFTDDQAAAAALQRKQDATANAQAFNDYRAPSVMDSAYARPQQQQHQQQHHQHAVPQADLLSMDNFGASASSGGPAAAAAAADLLDFGSSTGHSSSNNTSSHTSSSFSVQAPQTTDLLFGSASPAALDPFHQVTQSTPSMYASETFGAGSLYTGPSDTNTHGSNDNGLLSMGLSMPPPTTAPASVMSLASTADLRFSALDALAVNPMATAPTNNFHGNSTFPNHTVPVPRPPGKPSDAFGSLLGNIGSRPTAAAASFSMGVPQPAKPMQSSMTFANPPYSQPMVSSIRVSAPPMGPDSEHSDGNSGFLMGGAQGTGLEPLGPSPAAPPPPPPHQGNFY